MKVKLNDSIICDIGHQHHDQVNAKKSPTGDFLNLLSF